MPSTIFDYQSGKREPDIPADDYDPRNTFLTEQQEEILSRFLYCNIITLSRSEINLMMDAGLLVIHLPLNVDWFHDMPREANCSLNLAGQKYLKYRLEQTEKIKRENFRYRLTTGIAIVGVLMSLAALLWNILQQQLISQLI